MAAFTIIWLGQVVSLIGSAMSGFAITIWAWKLTGQATALALVGVCELIPGILFSPLAGALVDRWNKKLVMLLSDLASVLTSLGILVIYLSGHLQIWHLCLTGAFNGFFRAFQYPAYTAAITVMVPKEQYSRSSSMMMVAQMGSGVLAPSLAGALIGSIGLQGIIFIDFITFIIAILALLFVSIPPVPVSVDGKANQGSLWRESFSGFRYILARPGLLGLLLIFLFGNFFAAASGIITNPLILTRTNNNAQILGLVNSTASLAGVIGSLVVIAWGGPKRKIHGVIFGWLFGGLLGVSLFGVNGGIPVWLFAGAFGGFLPAIIDTSSQAIWQVKVPPDLQGRVSSVRVVFGLGTSPLAMLVSGILTDKVVGPAMESMTGFLPKAFGWVTGTGPGAGMALMILISGFCIVLVSLVSYAFPAIRNIENLLPDHEAAPQSRETGSIIGEYAKDATGVPHPIRD